MAEPCTALLVMPQEKRSQLLVHLDCLDTNVLTASDCSEAAEMLRRRPDVRVVLTDLTLPDGSWCDVLNHVSELRKSAEVVVCTRLADERLWTQVLEAGAFDLLVEPFQAHEVARIVRAAMGPRSLRRLAAAS
ncbi:MAG: response regulator [Acidobacteria bacterium]|nr:response regulator [Acidobacteriota bacterium]